MKYIRDFLKMDLIEAIAYHPIIGLPLKIIQIALIPGIIIGIGYFIITRFKDIILFFLKAGMITAVIILIITLLIILKRKIK